MSAVTLYQLSNQYQEALSVLTDSGDLPAEVVRDTLEGLTGELQDKAVNVAKFTLDLESGADAIEAAGKAMIERARRIRKRAESIRSYLLFNMQATGITKIECPEFVLAVRKNPEAVVIADGAVLPDEFMVTPEPPPARVDKKLLKDALKAGRVIDGAWLESGERLEVRA